MTKAKYIELYCDEHDELWRLTVWEIPSKDFDPFVCNFTNLPETFTNIQEASKAQRNLAQQYRNKGFVVHMNTSDPRSYFQLIPRWIVRLMKGDDCGE